MKRITAEGGTDAFERAVEALYDYMVEKDSNMPRTWCVRYVCNVAEEIKVNKENDDGTN